MTPKVILEAFGELPRNELINAATERERRERNNPPTGVTVVGLLHSAFDARAELMSWSTTSSSPFFASRVPGGGVKESV